MSARRAVPPEGGSPAPTFSVCTPTYDREHTLPRVYESLAAQTFYDFEWIVIDDGSTDGTGALVRSWQAGSPFPIRYVWQPNAGMGAAVNRGIDLASGRFFLILDSDDECVPMALERLLAHWERIPPASREGFVGVTGLVARPGGQVVGDPFPTDVFDSDALALRVRHRVAGEKWGFLRTDVLRVHKFPILEGEKCVFASTVWNRIALDYRTRYVNEVVRTYHPTAGSMSTRRALVESPRRGWYHYRSFQWLDYDLPVRWRLRVYAAYVRYALHSGVAFGEQAGEVRSALWWMGALPVGVAAYLLDRARLRLAGGTA